MSGGHCALVEKLRERLAQYTVGGELSQLTQCNAPRVAHSTVLRRIRELMAQSRTGHPRCTRCNCAQSRAFAFSVTFFREKKESWQCQAMTQEYR
jgi:hypothetical protein